MQFPEPFCGARVHKKFALTCRHLELQLQEFLQRGSHFKRLLPRLPNEKGIHRRAPRKCCCYLVPNKSSGPVSTSAPRGESPNTFLRPTAFKSVSNSQTASCKHTVLKSLWLVQVTPRERKWLPYVRSSLFRALSSLRLNRNTNLRYDGGGLKALFFPQKDALM